MNKKPDVRLVNSADIQSDLVTDRTKLKCVNTCMVEILANATHEKQDFYI